MGTVSSSQLDNEGIAENKFPFLLKSVSEASDVQRKVSIHRLPDSLQNWFDNQFPGLQDLLSQNEMIIAGSFPLQHLIGEKWGDSDVDIWIADKDKLRKLSSYLLAQGYNLPVKHGTVLTESDTYSRLKRWVRTIYVFQDTNRRKPDVQAILTHANVALKDLVESFDIDACCVFTDGEKLITSFENTNLKQRKTSLNSNAIFEQSPYEWFRTLRRVEKYMSRGFSFDWSGLDYALHESPMYNFIRKYAKVYPKPEEPYPYYPHEYGTNFVDAYVNKWNSLADQISKIGEIPHLVLTLNHLHFYIHGEVIYSIELIKKDFGKAIELIEEDLPTKCFDYIMFDETKFDQIEDTFKATIQVGDQIYCFSIKHFLKLFSFDPNEFGFEFPELRQFQVNSSEGIESSPKIALLAKAQEFMTPFCSTVMSYRDALKTLYRNSCNWNLEEFQCNRSILPFLNKLIKNWVEQFEKFEEEVSKHVNFNRVLRHYLDLNYIAGSLSDLSEGASGDVGGVIDNIYGIFNLIKKKYYVNGKTSERNSNIFFGCSGKDKSPKNPPLEDGYFLLRLTGNFLIPLKQVTMAIDSFFFGARHFVLKPMKDERGYHKRLDYTINYGLVNDEQKQSELYISADHCQAGSEKLVYQLYRKEQHIYRPDGKSYTVVDRKNIQPEDAERLKGIRRSPLVIENLSPPPPIQQTVESVPSGLESVPSGLEPEEEPINEEEILRYSSGNGRKE